jgi:hypothetical protein
MKNQQNTSSLLHEHLGLREAEGQTYESIPVAETLLRSSVQAGRVLSTEALVEQGVRTILFF